MAISKSKKKPAKSQKKTSASQKEKIAKSKKTAHLSKASSKVKKKKTSTREDEELLRRKAKKASAKSKTEDDDDDLVDEYDEDNVKPLSVVEDDSDSDGDDDEEDDDAPVDSDSDDDADDDDASEEGNVRDLSKIDPGPEISEVTCGFNCGSCTKFVKLDDPVRGNPEWVTKQIESKASRLCPFLFPEDIDTQGKPVSDFVVRADSKACDKFDFNDERASQTLLSVLGSVRLMDSSEIDVLAFSVDRIRTQKTSEALYGYTLGERCAVKCKGIERPVKCEVIDFQRKKNAEVIVRPLEKVKGIPSRLSIPARCAVEV